jgi:hypothetical protein
MNASLRMGRISLAVDETCGKALRHSVACAKPEVREVTLESVNIQV